jgi:hypothetical protein
MPHMNNNIIKSMNYYESQVSVDDTARLYSSSMSFYSYSYSYCVQTSSQDVAAALEYISLLERLLKTGDIEEVHLPACITTHHSTTHFFNTLSPIHLI